MVMEFFNNKIIVKYINMIIEMLIDNLLVFVFVFVFVWIFWNNETINGNVEFLLKYWRDKLI